MLLDWLNFDMRGMSVDLTGMPRGPEGTRDRMQTIEGEL